MFFVFYQRTRFRNHWTRATWPHLSSWLDLVSLGIETNLLVQVRFLIIYLVIQPSILVVLAPCRWKSAIFIIHIVRATSWQELNKRKASKRFSTFLLQLRALVRTSCITYTFFYRPQIAHRLFSGPQMLHSPPLTPPVYRTLNFSLKRIEGSRFHVVTWFTSVAIGGGGGGGDK